LFFEEVVVRWLLQKGGKRSMSRGARGREGEEERGN